MEDLQKHDGEQNPVVGIVEDWGMAAEEGVGGGGGPPLVFCRFF